MKKTDQHFVVCNVRIKLQQALLVLGIIDGLFVLGPGECLDRLE